MRAGETIFRQGDPPDGLYLVNTGEVAIFASAAEDADGVVFSSVRRGEAFGEIALLTGSARSATARAETDGELLRLDQGRFHDLVRRDPSVSLAISAGLIRRLRRADAARLGVPPSEVEVDSVAQREAGAAPRATSRAASRRRALGLILAALIAAAVWFVPSPPGLSSPGWHALLSLAALVPLLALEALPDGATSLLLVAFWVMSGTVAPRTALSGFSSSTWILTLCTFGVGAALASSGLLYRLALWAVARAAGFRAQVAMLGLGGLVLGVAVPNATGRMSLVASALSELADALGYEAGSSAAVGLAMAAYAGFGLMVAAFQTSSSTGLLALALLPDESRASANFVAWAVRAAPLHAVLLGGLLGYIMWRHAPRASSPQHGARSARAALHVQQVLLGRLSRHERIAGLVAIGLLIGFATQPLHGIDPAWVSVIAFVIMAGTGVLTLDTLKSINWNTLLLLGVLASMAEVVSTTKLDAWLAPLMANELGALSAVPVLFVVALALLCQALSLVLRWQAAVPLIVLALIPVARGVGIDPWVVAVVALTACNMFFLPFQSTIYVALLTGGGARLFRHPQARPFAFLYAALVVVGLVVNVPFWHALGLL